jgi:MFS family permease
VLVLSRIIGGIMGGNLSVATAAVADSTSREKRAGGLAIVGIAFGLGFIVGPAMGGLSAKINLLDYFPQLEAIGVNPFSMPALISLALTLINLIWVARCFEETLSEESRETANRERHVTPIFQIFTSGGPEIRRTNLLYLIFMFAFSGMEFTLTFLAFERFAFSPAQNGGMFVFIGFILILVQGGIVRRLSGPVGEKRLALAGLSCATLAFLCLALAANVGFFFLALALLGISIGLASPTLSALVSLYSDETKQGANLGAFRSAGSLARAGGPLFAAFCYFAFGSQSAYLFGAVIAIVPLVMAFKLPQPEKDSSAPLSS